MDTFPPCDPNPGWPYFADENLEPDGLKGCSWYVIAPGAVSLLTLVKTDTFNQPTNAANTISGSNIIYSPSCLLPLDHSLTLTAASSSTNNSYFDPKGSAKYPSTATWDQSMIYSVADNCDRAYYQQLPPNTLYGVDHGATSPCHSFSADPALSLDENADAAYKNWQASPHRYVLDAGNQASYASIPEELNHDPSISVDSVVSSANPSDVHIYPSYSTKRTRPQSLASNCHTSTSVSLVIEAPLLPSPVSNDDRSPIAPQSAILIRAKIPHSAVEKRYRPKLDFKLMELQHCVPTLHVKTIIEDESGSLDSTTGSPKQDGKLPKGLILDSAADYIRTLEARTSELDTHVELLERRLVVLQRITLEKTRGADSSLMSVDRKYKKSREARKSSSLSIAEASATGRASRSPKAFSTLGADSKRSLSKLRKSSPVTSKWPAFLLLRSARE